MLQYSDRAESKTIFGLKLGHFVETAVASAQLCFLSVIL